MFNSMEPSPPPRYLAITASGTSTEISPACRIPAKSQPTRSAQRSVAAYLTPMQSLSAIPDGFVFFRVAVCPIRTVVYGTAQVRSCLSAPVRGIEKIFSTSDRCDRRKDYEEVWGNFEKGFLRNEQYYARNT